MGAEDRTGPPASCLLAAASGQGATGECRHLPATREPVGRCRRAPVRPARAPRQLALHPPGRQAPLQPAGSPPLALGRRRWRAPQVRTPGRRARPGQRDGSVGLDQGFRLPKRALRRLRPRRAEVRLVGLSPLVLGRRARPGERQNGSGGSGQGPRSSERPLRPARPRRARGTRWAWRLRSGGEPRGWPAREGHQRRPRRRHRRPTDAPIATLAARPSPATLAATAWRRRGLGGRSGRGGVAAAGAAGAAGAPPRATYAARAAEGFGGGRSLKARASCVNAAR
jgi:hypothetical protein